MRPDVLREHLEQARHFLATLEKRAASGADTADLSNEGIQQLSNALEELRVSEEELRRTNEELATARQRLEIEQQRYRDLFDAAPNGYLVTSMQGVIEEANYSAATLL